jgi:hypothetical protein
LLHHETNKHTNTHIRHSRRLTERGNSIDRCHSNQNQVTFFFSLPSTQVTARMGQVAGKKQCGTVCAFCYLRLALQTKVLISQRCRSRSQQIPRLLWYPLSCRSSSPHVRNVRQMNPVHTLPRIPFKIQRNLYTPIYAQAFQVFSSL